MNWFEKLLPPKIKSGSLRKRGVPEGVWRKCDQCQSVLYADDLLRSLNVCPKCDHHMRINARNRLQAFFDQGEYNEIGDDVRPVDKLKFRDSKRYKDRLHEAGKTSGVTEALIVGEGKLHGMPLVAAAFEFQYMGGSMGSVVGERFVRGVDRAIAGNSAYVSYCASGGARMQEALFSLMQMAKTSAALTRLADHRLPYISVLTDPTMGGVSASLAMLGDVIIAEPNALVGFAGPRVIEQTVRETLPEGFQRAEFLLDHGAIDMIIDRRELRERIYNLITLFLPTIELATTESDVSEPTSDSDLN